MVADRISVRYSRTFSQVLGEDTDTAEIGGTITFDLPEGTPNWMDEYNKAYAILRTNIDGLMDGQVIQPKVEAPKALPGERISPKPTSAQTRAAERKEGEYMTYDESAQVTDIVPNTPVRFTDCRVFNVEVKRTSAGKPWASVRIGNRDQIPGQYATAKSFDPEIVSKLRALEERDMIDVWGYFSPWKDNESRDVPRFDLMVQRVERKS